jgi:hypothetical protein
MAWKKYAPKNTEVEGGEVSIYNDGTMRFNGAVHKALGLPNHIELYYDEDEQLLGFAPTSMSRPEAVALRQANADDGRRVKVAGALEALGIEYQATSRAYAARFVAPRPLEGPYVYIDLAAPVRVGGSAEE